MAITISGTDGVGITGNVGALTAGTAVASTSGTSIDFTGIPSFAKRITIMFSGVSTSGTARLIIQIGSGSVDTSGYASGGYYLQSSATNGIITATNGFVIYWDAAAGTRSGTMTLSLLNSSSNLWVEDHTLYVVDGANGCIFGAGTKTLSGVLDRVRITTSNGTDTFDAGSINILYE
jgi:hypothetical protein